MLKIFGVIIIIFSGAAVAYSLNKAARVSLTQVEGFIELVRYLRTEIECFSMPIPKALARCPDGILKKCGVSSGDSVSSINDLLGACGDLDDEVKEVMSGFAGTLGRGYKREQIALCDGTVERLEAYRESLAGNLPSKQRANGALCVCCSLAVVILLI